MALTYKKTGVDISGIKSSHKGIGRIISSTHDKSVKHGFGHYAGIVRAQGRDVAVHTDGVGTKVLIAGMMKKYDTIGIDCMGMNVNDMICTGATPIAFVDYIAANRNDSKIFLQIAKGLAKGAKISGTPIVGGETAIMPDMFAGRGFSFDLAGTVVGISKTKPLLGNAIKSKDVIIGVHSSGLHSNGYTLARKALLSKFSLKDKIRSKGTIGDALLEPTRIYTKPALEALQKCNLHGIGHITGGAFSKLTRLKNLRYEIESLPKMPPIMALIEEAGVSKKEMYRTFNMGVGLCIMAPQSEESRIRSIFKKHKIRSDVIGFVKSGKGVRVKSILV